MTDLAQQAREHADRAVLEHDGLGEWLGPVDRHGDEDGTGGGVAAMEGK